MGFSRASKMLLQKSKGVAKGVFNFYKGRLQSARQGKKDLINKQINDLKFEGKLPADYPLD